MITETSQPSPLQQSINNVLHSHLRDNEKSNSRRLFWRNIENGNNGGDFVKINYNEPSSANAEQELSFFLKQDDLNKDDYPNEKGKILRNLETGYPNRQDNNDRSIGFIAFNSKRLYRASSLRDSQIKKLLGDPLPLEEYTPLHDSKKNVKWEHDSSYFDAKSKVEERSSNSETNIRNSLTMSSESFDLKTPILENKNPEPLRVHDNFARKQKLIHTLYLPKKKFKKIENNINHVSDESYIGVLSKKKDKSVSSDAITDHGFSGPEDLQMYEYDEDSRPRSRNFENTQNTGSMDNIDRVQDDRNDVHTRHGRSRLFMNHVENARKNQVTGFGGLKNVYSGRNTRVFAEKKDNLKQPLSKRNQDQEERTETRILGQKNEEKEMEGTIGWIKKEMERNNNITEEKDITKDITNQAREINEKQLSMIDRTSSFNQSGKNKKDSLLLKKLNHEIELETLQERKNKFDAKRLKLGNKNNLGFFLKSKYKSQLSCIKGSRLRFLAICFFLIYFIGAAILYFQNDNNGDYAFNDMNLKVATNRGRGSGRTTKFISFDYFYY